MAKRFQSVHIPQAPSNREQIREMIRQLQSELAKETETFEESEDFDVGDDFDPNTPYEEVFDPGLGRSVTPWEMDRYKDRYAEQTQKRYPGQSDQERTAAEPPNSGAEDRSRAAEPPQADDAQLDLVERLEALEARFGPR